MLLEYVSFLSVMFYIILVISVTKMFPMHCLFSSDLIFPILNLN